jgi:hypothetical protein
MAHGDTAQLAAVIGAVGAPLLLLARTRGMLLAGFVVLAVAEAMLGYARAGDVHLSRFLRPAPLALAIVALVVVGFAAVMLSRRPELATPLILAAAPFRLPLDFGRDHRFFVSIADPGQLGRLLPLYGILAAAALALIVRVVGGEPVRALPRELSIPASTFLALASLSLLWTFDLPAGVNILAYFLYPFAVLLAVVGRTPFPDWMPRVLAIVGIALASLFAGIGIVQAATHTLFFYSPTVEVANTFSSFFRVTSLFRDPSLYGRHVVLGITIVLVAMWLGRLAVHWAGALIALMFAGLYFSYSQSSYAALFVVAVLVTAAVGDRRGRQLAAAVGLVVVVAGAVALFLVVKDQSLNRITSDRWRRIGDATEVFRDHALYGVGLGAQPLVAQRNSERFAAKARFVSHTTPLTVAGELGVVGLAAYLALLLGAARMFDQVRRRDVALGLTLSAVFVALFVHSLFYSGFVEDPITWFVLAAAASFLVYRRGAATEPAAILAPRSAPAPAPAP